MESLLCMLLLVLLLLVYFSNRQNAVNRRCAFAGFFFWLGLAKEAIGYNLVPFLENTLGIQGLATYFVLPYALMTWALYALAVPTAILFALSLGGTIPSPTLCGLLFLPLRSYPASIIPGSIICTSKGAPLSGWCLPATTCWGAGRLRC